MDKTLKEHFIDILQSSDVKRSKKIEENGCIFYYDTIDVLTASTLLDKAARTHCKGDWVKIDSSNYSTLPENGDEVVILINGVSRGTALYIENSDGYEFINSDYDFLDTEQVTHWQPLPTPPKEV